MQNTRWPGSSSPARLPAAGVWYLANILFILYMVVYIWIYFGYIFLVLFPAGPRPCILFIEFAFCWLDLGCGRNFLSAC